MANYSVSTMCETVFLGDCGMKTGLQSKAVIQ
jgi:hypothetical protein